MNSCSEVVMVQFHRRLNQMLTVACKVQETTLDADVKSMEGKTVFKKLQVFARSKFPHNSHTSVASCGADMLRIHR